MIAHYRNSRPESIIILGSDHRYLFPDAYLMNVILRLAADLVARVIISPATLPVGVLTAFLGAPVFICPMVGRQRI